MIKPLPKSVFLPLGLMQQHLQQMQEYIKKILGSGQNNMKTLIISNNEMEDIIKIVKSLEDSGLLLKGVSETVQNEVKEQKGGFLSMLLGTLGASLLGNTLTVQVVIPKSQGRGINRAGKGRTINTAGEGIVRAGYGNKKIDF